MIGMSTLLYGVLTKHFRFNRESLKDHTKFQYLNAGTGGIGGAFVHTNHFNTNLMILDGWWGNSSAARFAMFDNFDRASGANGFRISNPSIHQCATLLPSLKEDIPLTQDKRKYSKAHRLHYDRTEKKTNNNSFFLATERKYDHINNVDLAEMDEINMSIDVYDKDDRIDIVAEEPASEQQKQHSQLTLTKLTICGEKKKFF
ncbi:unnamed protein product [Rotaria socialis]|nr:unnamed protein product [Rotaria socialis]CAF4459939.1 unnamed protein product [Rotaria socialis]CAF4467903.1 unnamed protein product [Rotaria socialis]CAF4637149.1 unnamed protein product [Rotaria socialis]